MNYDQAKKMVDDAIEQRRRFGKHFGVSDVPPEFMDALVLVSAAQVTRTEFDSMGRELDSMKEQLVLANRQLGAAKSRETQLRKKLAELTGKDQPSE